jgi:hypothetical protein
MTDGSTEPAEDEPTDKSTPDATRIPPVSHRLEAAITRVFERFGGDRQR